MATLTYVYSDSTAVVGPLATSAEPHSYDLCERHAVRLTAPRGWEVVRYEGEFPAEPSADDLTALAEAVREAGRADRPLGESRDGRTRITAGRGAAAASGSAAALSPGPGPPPPCRRASRPACPPARRAVAATSGSCPTPPPPEDLSAPSARRGSAHRSADVPARRAQPPGTGR